MVHSLVSTLPWSSGAEAICECDQQPSEEAWDGAGGGKERTERATLTAKREHNIGCDDSLTAPERGSKMGTSEAVLSGGLPFDKKAAYACSV